MRLFWAWFGWLAAVWIGFLITAWENAIPYGMIGCALFFSFWFLLDLSSRRPWLYAVLLSGCALVSFGTSFLLSVGRTDMYVIWFNLLLASVLAVRGMKELPGVKAWICSVMSACVLAASSIIFSGAYPYSMLFVLLYILAFAAAMIDYRGTHVNHLNISAQYEALLNEYRDLKRRARLNEEAARAEERTEIARQIHDSVGHKLTSLLMQLEMFRMQAKGADQEQAEQMKRLAQESLNETRSAVKALKEQEPGGIPALLNLIRNLEAENYMQIEFVVRHGALSIPLGNDQSIAVYRAIQEALTNAMRHGSSRHINIVLESPGGRVFRFEVTNAVADRHARPVREGFGLSAMRERMEKAGGTLEITKTGQQFIVQGSFLIGP